VRKIFWTIFGLWLCGVLVAARADTYQLTDGSSVTGDIVTFNDSGITFRVASDVYTNLVWTKFSQSALKQLSENPKIQPLVEPFIEIPPSQRPPEPEIQIHDVTRLDLPPRQSLLGALASSSVGLFVLLLIYAANLYAAFEIAIVRGQPMALVMGVSAVLPILGPIVFLSLPAKAVAGTGPEQVEGDPATFAVAGPHPITENEIQTAGAAMQNSTASQPPPQIFQRGQYTFNRRFLETKFSGFFGAIRRGPDKDSVLLVKTTREQFVASRITRIAANDVHFEIVAGAGVREVMVPFADIQEMQLKPGGV